MQSPCPCGRPPLTRTSTGDTQTLKGRSGSVSAGSQGPGVHKVLFEPSECLWQVWGLILNTVSPLLPSCWGFSFALRRGYLYLVGSNILLLMVVQQQVAILEFSQEKMSARPSTPPSWFPPKVHLVKAMVFPVVMYGCESWTVNKAEHRRIDALELWCWGRLLRVPWTPRSPVNPKEINHKYSLERLMLKLQSFGHLM